MVFFTCAGCGESLKKCQVEKHRFRCRRSNHLTCIDCCKDFFDEDYQTHTKCISEDQKYGGANYVAKENKGEVKQEKWFETVQAAIDKLSKSNNNKNRQLLSLLQGLRRYPNVPRKEAKFKNFAKSTFKGIDESVVIEAWAAIKSISDELNPPKPPPTPAKQESSGATQNGNSINESDQKDKKRKKKDSESENAHKETRESSPAKKKSKKETSDKLNSQENIPDEKSASEEKEDADKSPSSADENTTASPAISVKSLVKKLLKQSENGELTLKRLKKYARKEMQCTNDEQKADLCSKIDEFLKKNTKKYATDGKIVRFACKS